MICFSFRVAIILQKYSNYVINTNDLQGPYEVITDQLEILGYTVVNISQHDWNSLSIYTDEEKVELLKQHIYQKLLTKE